jgi:hypothetical protein
MVPEATEPRNGCARLSSPVGIPARLAPLGLPPFLARQESRARRPPLRSGPRSLPEPAKLQGALADMFDALVATVSDTRLEPDLHALLWSLVNVFHRRIDRIERDLDANESAQRMGQREQDGSEVRSVELERLVVQGLTLIERRNSFEFIRDAAARKTAGHALLRRNSLMGPYLS